MPTIKIGPDEYVEMEYKVPRHRLVEFEVEADLPVKTYVLGPKALRRFSEGSSTFRYYGGFPDARRSQHQAVRLPFTGVWYLVIMNPDKQASVRVEYEVYY